MEDRTAQINFYDEAKYELKVGLKTVDFDPKDEIFGLTAPIEESKNTGS